MSEPRNEIISTGGLSLALSLSLPCVIAIFTSVVLIGTTNGPDSWLHSGWRIAGNAMNVVSFVLAAATLGGLIGLLFGSWLSRRFIIVFWTTVGLFAPPIGLLLVITAYPAIPIPLRVEQVLPFFGATGVAGLVLGFVLARGRTGLTHRSRRLAMIGAALGAVLGPASVIVSRIGRNLLQDTNFQIHDSSGTAGLIVVVGIVSTLLGAALGAALGADRQERVGFPVQVMDAELTG